MRYSLFSLDIVPMQKLFLINFEQDPDEIYHALEPQWFDGPDYGRGLRVVAWRKDGYVDVYQQPDLPKDEDFSVARKRQAESLELTLLFVMATKFRLKCIPWEGGSRSPVPFF